MYLQEVGEPDSDPSCATWDRNWQDESTFTRDLFDAYNCVNNVGDDLIGMICEINSGPLEK